MSKIELNDTVGGFDISSINDNFTRIEQELQEKVLYREHVPGEPNSMDTVLDMNGHSIINIGNFEAGQFLNVEAAAVTLAEVIGLDATNVQEAIEELAGGVGSAGSVGFSHAETYVAGSIGAKLKKFVSVLDEPFNADNTGVADCTAAFDAAIAHIIAGGGGGVIWAPAGTYKFNGSVSAPDGYKTGILIPDTGADFTTSNGITIVGDGVDTVFKAGSVSMVMLRVSRLYSGGESFRIDGDNLSNVWGLGNIPENMGQTTELVSHSFGSYRNITIENCYEGHVIMPGPTVGGSDSGCFYFDFHGFIYNNNLRDVWTKKDVTGMGNRVTRSSWYSPRFTRGNTGVQIDGGTEIDFYSPNFESKNTGTSPSAIPTAFNYNDTNPANIRIFGGYAEGCTKALVSINPSQVQAFGFFHNSTKDSTEFSMGRYTTGRLTVPKMLNTAAYINMGGENYVGFVGDPDQNNSKTIELQINGAQKTRWNASGDMIFYGSLGNTTIYRTGGQIIFSGTSSSIQAQETFITYADSHYLRSAGGASGLRLDTEGSPALLPEVDNAFSLGISGGRWSSVWSANGVIQTSDPRTKMDITPSPLGLNFINLLQPKAYRFKVGGNTIGANGAVAPKAGVRIHYGLLTTNVKEAADACGATDFGGYVKTNPLDPNSEEGLRYDEFISPIIKAIQELSAKVAALENNNGQHV